jgi:hypothetical protein
MEQMQRSQLAASRRELLSRVSSRWASDTEQSRAMGGQAGGQVYGHGGMSFGPPPHATWTGRQPNPRSKTYLTHIRCVVVSVWWCLCGDVFAVVSLRW